MIEHDACVSSLHTISFERQFGHSITGVWGAVSDESQVATWMEYPTRLKPELGTSVLIDFSPEEPIRGVVCTVEAEKLLAYTWQNSIVRWELSGVDGSILLTFSHIAVQPEFVVGLCAGWQCFIDNLGAHLAAEPFVDRFDELQQAYQKELAAQVF